MAMKEMTLDERIAFERTKCIVSEGSSVEIVASDVKRGHILSGGKLRVFNAYTSTTINIVGRTSGVCSKFTLYPWETVSVVANYCENE